MSDTLITLNKYLADCGVASRRNAALLIKDGEVLVNNRPVKEPGYRVKPTDVIKFQGKIVRKAEKVYLMLNKPKGYVSSLSDPYHERTVISLVKGASKDRIYPVGRLDAETTGLLLLTNDGEFAQKLAHPKYEIRKVYHVVLDRPLHEEDMDKIRKGLLLSDGRVVVDRIFYIAKKPKNMIGVEIHSGKNRIVRRIFAKVGYDVELLDRVAFASITKRGVGLGTWRYLNKKEIAILRGE